jgi:hypothetical protein
MSDEMTLREQLKIARREIRLMQLTAEQRNRDLDALHMVWCDGTCARGVHRYADEIATADELNHWADIGQRNVDRLRAKAVNRRYKERITQHVKAVQE